MGTPVEERRDALVERLLQSTLGFFDVYTVYLGDRLGLYQAIAEGGPATPAELASNTGTNERHVREWLEQQTVAGIIEVEDATAGSSERRYRMPDGHAEVLTDTESLNFLAPLAQLAVGAASPTAAILDAYRTGKGVPYGDYGPDLIEGQGAINRASFLYSMGDEWLSAIPDVHERLRSDPPARIADVGCGVGWSCIGMARAYPNVTVDGLDLDGPSIDLAKRNIDEAGLVERVTAEVRDAADPQLSGQYDLVTAFECIHDMSDPVAALRAMRGLAADGGTVLVVDERVGESLSEPSDVEQIMYGWSVLHCLPVGMAEQPSVATGTVMRPQVLRQYAAEAGFNNVEVLPIENYFFQFYRLTP